MSKHRSRQQTMTRWVIIVVVLAVAVSLAAAIPWGSDDNGKKATTSTSQSAPPVLTGSAAELATLLTNAHKHTFHARYAVHGDKKIIGGTLTLEWWNTKDRSRVDTIRTGTDQVAHTASFVNNDSGVSCTRIDSGAWTCQAIDVAAPGDPGGIVTQITSQLSGRVVTEHKDKVDGHAARCFDVAGGTEAISVCTNADGVLLRNASSQVTYEVTTLDSTVPAEIFTPPAATK